MNLNETADTEFSKSVKISEELNKPTNTEQLVSSLYLITNSDGLVEDDSEHYI